MKTETRKLINGATLTLVKDNSMDFQKGDVVLVTDPCYWFDEEDKEAGFDLWAEFNCVMFPENWSTQPDKDKLWKYCTVKYVTREGVETNFLMTSTAHGDGCYDVGGDGGTERVSGGETAVDAGCFAVVKLEEAKRFKSFRSNLETTSGTVIRFLKDGQVNVDGESMTGSIECDTDPDCNCNMCGESAEWCECNDDFCEVCGESEDKFNCLCEDCDSCGEKIEYQETCNCNDEG